VSDDLTKGFVPFPAERAGEYRRRGYWTGRPLDSILRDAAASWPHRIGIVDDEVGYSFAELDALADRFAAGVAGLGISPGDRVLLQLPNSCRFAIATFGLLRAGAVPVMCLPGHRVAELGHFADVSGAVGLVIPARVGGFDYRELAARLTAEETAIGADRHDTARAAAGLRGHDGTAQADSANP
jgi:mycobactin salicyl-AMP ligase